MVITCLLVAVHLQLRPSYAAGVDTCGKGICSGNAGCSRASDMVQLNGILKTSRYGARSVASKKLQELWKISFIREGAHDLNNENRREVE